MPDPKPPAARPSASGLRRTSLARASLELVGDLARVLVEPPVQPAPLATADGGLPPRAPTVLDAMETGSTLSVRHMGTGSTLSDKHKGDARWCEDGVRRSGGTLSATAHVITAVIGAGVLSLPAAMASLGYAGGCIVFVAFGLVTLYTAQLLADLYCIDGVRQRTYSQVSGG